MKSLSTQYKDNLLESVTSLTVCIHIKRKDGIEYFFTTLDKPITIDGNIYIPNNSFIPTDYTQKLGLSVDNMDISGILNTDSISKTDILNGYFNNAQVWIFLIDYKNISNGKEKICYGHLGEAEISKDTYTIEFRSLTQKLSQNIGNVFSRVCRAEFGDSKCGIINTPVSGTVSSSTTLTFKYLKFRFISTKSHNKLGEINGEYNNTDSISSVVNPSVIVNTTVSSENSPEKLIDTLFNYNVTIFDENNTENCEIVFKYDSEIQMDRYRLYLVTSASFPEEWKIYISSDGINYTLIDHKKHTFNTSEENSYSQYFYFSDKYYSIIYDNSRTEPDGYFNNGKVIFTSGNNSGLGMEIKNYSKGIIELVLPLPNLIEPGDTYEIYRGCNKLYIGLDGTIATGDCITKYNNGLNFRGEPYLPTEDKLTGGLKIER